MEHIFNGLVLKRQLFQYQISCSHEQYCSKSKKLLQDIARISTAVCRTVSQKINLFFLRNVLIKIADQYNVSKLHKSWQENKHLHCLRLDQYYLFSRAHFKLHLHWFSCTYSKLHHLLPLQVLRHTERGSLLSIHIY